MGAYIYALPVCFSILCRALSLPAFSPAIQSREGGAGDGEEAFDRE